jgi:hypothetical protein
VEKVKSERENKLYGVINYDWLVSHPFPGLVNYQSPNPLMMLAGANQSPHRKGGKGKKKKKKKIATEQILKGDK